MKTYPTRLDMIADNLPPDPIGAEIGVQRGDFSAQILTLPIKQLHLVDCWCPRSNENPKDPANIDAGGHEANFRFVVVRFKNELIANRVVLHRVLSPMIRGVEFHSFDFVYIDAAHGYFDVLDDLNYWGNTVMKTGSLFVHDYIDNEKSKAMGFGVKQAVDDWIMPNRWKIAAITSDEWPTVQLVRK